MQPIRVLWATENAPDRDKALARLQPHYPDRVVVFAGITTVDYGRGRGLFEAWVFDAI